MLTFRRLRSVDVVIGALRLLPTLAGSMLAVLFLQGALVPLGPVTTTNAPLVSEALIILGFTFTFILWQTLRLLQWRGADAPAWRRIAARIILLVACVVVLLCLVALGMAFERAVAWERGAALLLLFAALLNLDNYSAWIVVQASSNSRVL